MSTPITMKKIQFSIEINAPREKVWSVLWDDITLRQWAGIIDEGTYLKGELKQGGLVEFISASGYGVTTLVEKLEPQSFILFKHQADTINNGKQEREKEWTGGTESYTLTEKDGITSLVVGYDIPPSQEEYFQDMFPKALAEIKLLAEK